MKKKIIIGIGILFLLGIISYAIAEPILSIRSFNINETYLFEVNDSLSWICLKIDGYPGHDPCFDVNEINLEKGSLDLSSKILISNRLNDIDSAIAETLANQQAGISQEQQANQDKYDTLKQTLDGLEVTE